MSQEPKDTNNLAIQVEEMQDLIKSPEWRHYLQFLRERKSFLQNKVNTLLGSNEEVKAKIALALMHDCDKQIELFRQKVSEAESKLKGTTK